MEEIVRRGEYAEQKLLDLATESELETKFLENSLESKSQRKVGAFGKRYQADCGK